MNKIWIAIGLIAIVLGSSIFLNYKKLLLAVGNTLIVQDELQPADVIHVIAGHDYRTEYAIQLFNQGLGKTVFFTGGWCTEHLYYHGQHARSLALAAGIPQTAIVADDTAVKSTYEEVERLKVWIDQNPSPIRSVLVISDPFHMLRARWTYQQILGEKVKIEMAPVPFALTPYRQEWWTDDLSRGYVRDEYEKLVYYIIRYKLAWGPFKDWLASLDTN